MLGAYSFISTFGVSATLTYEAYTGRTQVYIAFGLLAATNSL